jgi:flagellar hook-associated protein 3 FlgL
MRIGSFQSYNSQVSRMADLQSTIDRLQTQIATGKRVLQPSDDPLGSNRVADLQRSIDNNQQFIRNMDRITTQLSLADSAVESMGTQLIRAKELVITASNGTMTATDRQNISTELGQIIEQMLALSNTRDSAGNYVFSGAAVGTAPFARDALGAIVWQGSGEPPRIPVNADVTVSAGANGLSMLSISTSSGTQTILQSLIDVKAALDNPPTTPAEEAAFQAAMDKGLEDIESGVNRLIDQRAIFGSRMAQVDTESERLKTLETTMTDAKSKIESLDVAGAITQLQSAMTLLQVSQQSFGQIKKLSLFQYL